MALIRWEPARDVQSLQEEMNRLFGTFFDQPTGLAWRRQWVPAMDLLETEKEYVPRADLPGLTKDDVSIELEDTVLTISGERIHRQEEQRDGFARFERATGRFSRSLTLPDGIDGADIDAEFTDGVLEVRIPKPERRQPHRVAIRAKDGQRTIESTAEDREPTPA